MWLHPWVWCKVLWYCTVTECYLWLSMMLYLTWADLTSCQPDLYLDNVGSNSLPKEGPRWNWLVIDIFYQQSVSLHLWFSPVCHTSNISASTCTIPLAMQSGKGSTSWGAVPRSLLRSDLKYFCYGNAPTGIMAESQFPVVWSKKISDENVSILFACYYVEFYEKAMKTVQSAKDWAFLVLLLLGRVLWRIMSWWSRFWILRPRYTGGV